MNYPSFKCPSINIRSKIQKWVGEQLVSWCFRRVLSSDWKSEVNFCLMGLKGKIDMWKKLGEDTVCLVHSPSKAWSHEGFESIKERSL